MKIIYRISEQDYMAARDLFVANERPLYRRISRRLMPWIGGFLLVTQVAYAAIVPNANLTLASFCALIGVYFLYCGFALRRYFRRSYRKDRRFEHDFTADVSEEGIHIVTTTAEARVKWAGFVRFLESDEIFMLFHSEWLFNIFPKRAFAAGEADSFRELLRLRIHAPK